MQPCNIPCSLYGSGKNWRKQNEATTNPAELCEAESNGCVFFRNHKSYSWWRVTEAELNLMHTKESTSEDILPVVPVVAHSRHGDHWRKKQRQKDDAELGDMTSSIESLDFAGQIPWQESKPRKTTWKRRRKTTTHCIRFQKSGRLHSEKGFQNCKRSPAWSVPTGEALVPLFDFFRVSVAHDISGDVVVHLKWIVQVKIISQSYRWTA